jgi:DNA-directed RNA polymerase specialized sigma24 family protein
MTPEVLADELVPIAAELVGTVRDYGPADVAAVLARVPQGRHDALAVVLAAMVDPDARPHQLLAWTQMGPVSSREFTPDGYQLKALTQEELGRRPERRAEVARLTAAGLSAEQIAERLGVTSRSVTRHRKYIRLAAEVAS